MINYSYKKFILLFLFFNTFLLSQNILWYKQPANVWEEALPIGNGRLGGMVFGRVNYERIQLNEESLWTGSPTLTVHDKPDAYKYLSKVRTLLFDGKYKEAQEITEKNMMVEGTWNMYQTLGDLFIGSKNPAQVSEYRRELDLDSAIIKVSYKSGDITYKREYLSSPVDQVIVIRYTASKPGSLNLSARLMRAKDASVVASDNMIKMKGQVTAGGVDVIGLNPGVHYETQLMAFNKAGKISISGDSLVIENADTVTFYLAAATDYWGKDPHITCEQTIKPLITKQFDIIKRDHVVEHQRLFNRVKIDLGSNENAMLSTDERLKAVKDGKNDPQLFSLYFQYGRYLLICSSRPGDLPANFQGIWAEDKYHPGAQTTI